MPKEQIYCWRCKRATDTLHSTPNPGKAMESVALCPDCFPIVAGEPLRKGK